MYLPAARIHRELTIQCASYGGRFGIVGYIDAGQPNAAFAIVVQRQEQIGIMTIKDACAVIDICITAKNLFALNECSVRCIGIGIVVTYAGVRIVIAEKELNHISGFRYTDDFRDYPYIQIQNLTQWRA